MADLCQCRRRHGDESIRHRTIIPIFQSRVAKLAGGCPTVATREGVPCLVEDNELVAAQKLLKIYN